MFSKSKSAGEPVPCYECGHEVTKSTITCPKCAVFSPGEAKPSPAKVAKYDEILREMACPHCGKRGHYERKKVCHECNQRLPLWFEERHRRSREQDEVYWKTRNHSLYAGLGIVFVIWLILCYFTASYSYAIVFIGILGFGFVGVMLFTGLHEKFTKR